MIAGLGNDLEFYSHTYPKLFANDVSGVGVGNYEYDLLVLLFLIDCMA